MLTRGTKGTFRGTKGTFMGGETVKIGEQREHTPLGVFPKFPFDRGLRFGRLMKKCHKQTPLNPTLAVVALRP